MALGSIAFPAMGSVGQEQRFRRNGGQAVIARAQFTIVLLRLLHKQIDDFRTMIDRAGRPELDEAFGEQRLDG